jgi:hypothetical protein
VTVRCNAATTGSASLHLDTRKSPATRVPEGKDLQDAICDSVVEIVVDALEGHAA